MGKVVAFIGVIGSGKDYRANRAVRDGKSKRVNFKDALLAMASDLVGYDVQKNYDWFKEAIVGMEPPRHPLDLAYLREDVKDALRKHPNVMTGRRLLQRLGTDCMRKRDPDYWAHQYSVKAKGWLDGGWDIVTADCRFANEVGAIKKLDPEARFIFCNYRSPRYDARSQHESERMAQKLLAIGLQNGQRIGDGDLAKGGA